MPLAAGPPVVSQGVDPDDGMEEEGPFSAWLPPDDRLWRHPSEIGGGRPAGFDPTHDFDTRDLDSARHLVAAHDAARTAAHGEGSHGGVGTLLRTGPVRTWTVAVVAGLVGALLASGVSLATGDFGAKTTVLNSPVRVAPTDTVALAVQSPGAPPAPNWVSVNSVMAASVVAVLASSGAAGSGVLYATRGGRTYVLTSDDLTTGTIEVTFNDGKQQSARLVDADPGSGLALLSVDGVQPTLPTFGSVSELRVAEPVLAVSGNDQGDPVDLSLSSVDDAATVSDTNTLVSMLAVTGSTTTGEGAALVDGQGRVVGITTAMTATNPGQQGTSYAIPIDVAEHVAEQLFAGQTVTHPYLGIIQTQDLPSAYAHEFDIAGGAEVETVAPGSPANAAGLRSGDTITAVDGDPVTSAGGLVSRLCAYAPGRSVNLTYVQPSGRHTTVSMRVINQPSNIDDPDGD
jgi:S1-C subfamily serine protease